MRSDTFLLKDGDRASPPILRDERRPSQARRSNIKFNDGTNMLYRLNKQASMNLSSVADADDGSSDSDLDDPQTTLSICQNECELLEHEYVVNVSPCQHHILCQYILL